MSEYNFFPRWTKPPYTTITAYDLSTGDIKWQVPDGDDPETLRGGGPGNTGGLHSRNNGIVVTRGLVFHAGSDGKFRAYDEDTGAVLWSGSFGGLSIGVPVAYTSRGRDFVVMMSAGVNTPGGAPVGAVAFTLPGH